MCYATIRNEDDIDTRVSPTGVRGVHLGRDGSRDGWHIYIPSLNRITTSRDIVFDEQKFLRFDSDGREIEDTSRFVEDDGKPVEIVRAYNETMVCTSCQSCQCMSSVKEAVLDSSTDPRQP